MKERVLLKCSTYHACQYRMFSNDARIAKFVSPWFSDAATKALALHRIHETRQNQHRVETRRTKLTQRVRQTRSRKEESH